MENVKNLKKIEFNIKNKCGFALQLRQEIL